MLRSRVPVAVGLALGTGILLHLHYEVLLFLLVQGASIYDLSSIARRVDSVGRAALLLATGISVIVSNLLLLLLYWRSSSTLIEIVTLTQVSDILQYLGGNLVGRTRIGSISPKKTYEGYLVSLALILTGSWILDLSMGRVVIYWSLGVTGGLVNSLIKRSFDLKDFSDLLGDHGGWLDRSDSIYLPGFFAYFLQW
uniref:Phosphatidate cytidylyltransferase n=1 Tax=viral metagenome TaxID=1070528 RepID=A0A6C0IZE8_9ZZZZ